MGCCKRASRTPFNFFFFKGSGNPRNLPSSPPRPSSDLIDKPADFSTLDLTADNTVHLDGARTVGTLKFGDTPPSHNWIIDNNNNAANVLTLAVTSGKIGRAHV